MSVTVQVALQNAVNGLLLGGMYATVAVGFSIVWGVLNIVNLAHGSLVMLGAYLTYWLFATWGVDPLAALPLAALALFLVGYPLQRLVINQVVRASFLITFLLTFGIDLLITNLALAAWTADIRSVTPSYAGWSLDLGPVTIPVVRLAALVVAIVVAAALQVTLTRTRLGRAIRATAADGEAARLMGIPIARIYAVTFALAAASAGVAGGLISVSFPIYPAMGATYTLVAFVVCVLGGLGTVVGALVGGLVLGLAETFAAAWLGPNYDDIVAFSILILVLVVRPSGLLGHARRFRG